jgi:hypothetical protein
MKRIADAIIAMILAFFMPSHFDGFGNERQTD